MRSVGQIINDQPRSEAGGNAYLLCVRTL